MQHPGFFQREGPYPLKVIAEATGAELVDLCDGEKEIDDLRPLHQAAGHAISPFAPAANMPASWRQRMPRACLIKHRDAELVPEGAAAVMTDAPHRAFAIAVGLLYPEALQPTATGAAANAPRQLIHPTAQIAEGVRIEPGAVIGREARSAPERPSPPAPSSAIAWSSDRNCYIGPGAAVTHALIGERVISMPACASARTASAIAMSAKGHVKVPQVGRVIIGDHVEIGANSTIDRGFLTDTVIGEGTKIDNLVQIAHNVVIGRHCVIIAQSGIAGSAQLGDFVIMGAQSGIVEHVKVGQARRLPAWRM